MLWIKEVEMVDSVDDLRTLQSIGRHTFPNCEMLDTKSASALKNIILNSDFKKKISQEEQKAQLEDRFLRGRQIVYLIYDYFRVTGALEAVLDYTDLLSVTSLGDDVPDFYTRWDEVLSTTSDVPNGKILESLCQVRIRESDQRKTVLAMYEQEINQDPSKPSYQKLKTMVKRHRNQKIRTRTFQARNERIETGV